MPPRSPNAPMLSTLVTVPPVGPDWTHEIKFDGWRIIAQRSASALALTSRAGKDWSSGLAGIASALRRLPADTFVIDGEAVVLRPDGRSDFHAMRGRMPDAVMMAFDLLDLDGRDLRGEPIEVRRTALSQLLDEADSGVRFSQSLDVDGPTAFRHACALGLEGIVSKRRGSRYVRWGERPVAEVSVCGVCEVPWLKRSWFG